MRNITERIFLCCLLTYRLL
uniref:Uncharacterized protein n=1 Tax=Arundo donax TaxID=35708 RepID=A0A0A8Z3Z6_ARUDO